MGLFSTKKQIDSSVQFVRAGLSWDEVSGKSFDLDISAFLLNKDGAAVRDENFVFYNNAFSPDRAVVYGGDNRSGEGEGFDETILIHIKKIPADISRIVICITADNDGGKDYLFGGVKNAVLDVQALDEEFDKDGAKLASINLSKDYPMNSGLIGCELIRSGDDWKFSIPCENVRGGMEWLCKKYGLEVE